MLSKFILFAVLLVAGLAGVEAQCKTACQLGQTCKCSGWWILKTCRCEGRVQQWDHAVYSEDGTSVAITKYSFDEGGTCVGCGTSSKSNFKYSIHTQPVSGTTKTLITPSEISLQPSHDVYYQKAAGYVLTSTMAMGADATQFTWWRTWLNANGRQNPYQLAIHNAPFDDARYCLFGYDRTKPQGPPDNLPKGIDDCPTKTLLPSPDGSVIAVVGHQPDVNKAYGANYPMYVCMMNPANGFTADDCGIIDSTVAGAVKRVRFDLGPWSGWNPLQVFWTPAKELVVQNEAKAFTVTATAATPLAGPKVCTTPPTKSSEYSGTKRVYVQTSGALAFDADSTKFGC